MRPATELRQRWLETVPRMFLENLCFLDERDDDFAAVRRTLGDRYGACGVPGAFGRSEWAALIDEARTWPGQRDVRRDDVEAPGLVLSLFGSWVHRSA
ncbi:hypothetical protein [Nonomuraea sp. NPDC003214]